ncbi:hypothetical protein GCM10020218_098410 [Dactylosporangium vinaceum]
MIVLGRAARLVNQVNEGRAGCIEGVALLDRVARLVEVRAEPLAVAVAAQGPAGTCVLGDAVRDMVPLADGGRVVRGPHFDPARWNGAGHLVLYAAQAGWWFDPTLDQVSRMTGLPGGTLMQQITPEEISSGDLPFEIGGGQVLYRVVRADTTWQAAYNAEYARLGGIARAATQRALELEGFDEDLI